MATTEIEKEKVKPHSRHSVMIEMTTFRYNQIKELVKKGLTLNPTTFCREAVFTRIDDEFKKLESS